MVNVVPLCRAPVVARPAAAYIRPSSATCPGTRVSAARSGQTNHMAVGCSPVRSRSSRPPIRPREESGACPAGVDSVESQVVIPLDATSRSGGEQGNVLSPDHGDTESILGPASGVTVRAGVPPCGATSVGLADTMTTSAVRARSVSGELPPRAPGSGQRTEGGTGQVVSHVRELIERGALKPGDRLPAERDLATQIGVSRPTIRAGLRTLAAMGVVRSRHGSGTYIPEGPPALNTDALSFFAALHGFTREEMYEARRILEVGAAGLAAERATAEQVATLADSSARKWRASLPRCRSRASSSCTTSTFIARWRRRRATRLWRRSSRWSRRSTTSAGARPRRPRANAISATPPRCTAASTRRFALATPIRRGARCTITCSRRAGISLRSRRPMPTCRRAGPFGTPRAGSRRRYLLHVARAYGDLRLFDHTS